MPNAKWVPIYSQKVRLFCYIDTERGLLRWKLKDDVGLVDLLPLLGIIPVEQMNVKEGNDERRAQ